MMSNDKILVLYYSQTGNTTNMAHAVARGVEKTGMEACMRSVASIADKSGNIPLYDNSSPEACIQDLKDCYGLAIGSPTHFGNMAAPLKHFLDQTTELWIRGSLDMKPFGVFTSTSSMHGGQEATLLTMMLPFLHHGMIFCGLSYTCKELEDTRRGGTPYGPSHYSGDDAALDRSEKKLCESLGFRIATVARSMMERRDSEANTRGRKT